MFVHEKVCGRCDETLPITAFNRAGSGYQHWCRECFRAYFRERGALHLAQVKAAIARRRIEARRFIVGYLREHPCADCGEPDPVVLEFDHLRDKRHHISNLVGAGASPNRLRKEIAKCDVVCANCHRRRTAGRRAFPSYRLDEARLVRMRSPVQRNVRHILRLLEAAVCEDCGEADAVVLDFDHVGPKRESVIVLAFGGYGLSTLKREIAECEIRCVNCHRRRTALVGGYYRAVA